MSRLRGRRVLLGVTGGIAAYKAPELVRALRAAGAEVRVIVTAGGAEFVSTRALEVLSENRVAEGVFDRAFEHEIGHIALARWPDVVLIAPATANFIAKLRVGLADDLLTTVLLATTAPVVVAPAMNTQMLGHPAVVENLSVLAARPGTTIVAPDSGSLACGEVGAGRLPDPPVLLAALERAVPGGGLSGRHVVVSAGPTRERFDPVRFLSNPSTGRMGFAIAAAAVAAGADVTLVAGPTSLPTPPGAVRVDVESAAQMRAAIVNRGCDVLVMTAAVADWTPAEPSPHKRKKTAGVWDPRLDRTADILAEVSASAARPRLLIGFAAETENVVEYARAKLAAKRLDAIVANDVGAGGAFGSESNTITLLAADGEAIEIGPAPKREVADALVAWIAGALARQA
ncbi:MAG: bifunctional phosphopantothenoylcysteine decarboxylase/phosphopantothenate--cysteine ligase CoaBC [Myxococcales bacterium]|nr:bifunctional phosphopantothenoylcysteine decarboxylase/phosphopantothenate--cysteine ligase CoaBC [Myxococcales bacterium]